MKQYDFIFDMTCSQKIGIVDGMLIVLSNIIMEADR